MHVLLVEDDDEIRSLLTEVMTEAGFDVVKAHDAESALRSADALRSLHLVVSDVNLGPGMDGFALATLARRKWPTVAVLLISGSETNFVGLCASGAERFLSKPFSVEALLRNVAELTGEPANTPHANPPAT